MPGFNLRSVATELHFCTGAYRISPVDVNSRPSSCLTNFLLNGQSEAWAWALGRSRLPEMSDGVITGWLVPLGRSVLLEQPRKSGSKVISHMLSSHGGEIFLHVLNCTRSTLEDPPSISEGCGGRVTDYRITVSDQASPLFFVFFGGGAVGEGEAFYGAHVVCRSSTLISDHYSF